MNVSLIKRQETVSLNINDKIENVVNIDDTALILVESERILNKNTPKSDRFVTEWDFVGSYTPGYRYNIKLHKYNKISRTIIALSNKYVTFGHQLHKLYYSNSNSSIYFWYYKQPLLSKYNLGTNKWEYIDKKLENSRNVFGIKPSCLYAKNNELHMMDYSGKYFIYNETDNDLREIMVNNTINKFYNYDNLMYNSKWNVFIIYKANKIFSFSPETIKWKLLFEGNFHDSNMGFMDWFGSGTLISGMNNDYIIGYGFSLYLNSLIYMCYNMERQNVNIFGVKYPYKLIGLYCTKKNKYYINILIYGFIRNMGINTIKSICDIIMSMYNDEYIEFINKTDHGISINKCTWNQFTSKLHLQKISPQYS